jgi:glyoxylase-like metal-dependent hydrolase (beta-lactamase superfamily II)
MTSSSTRVVHQLGGKLFNFYLVDTGEGLVLVDAGLPAHWKSLVDKVHEVGAQLTDIRAVLITHAHPDHMGLAERLRVEAGTEVWVHAADAPILATPGKVRKLAPPERSILPYALRRPSGMQTPLQLVRGGGLRAKGVAKVRTFDGDAVLDLPGEPRAVHMPGHTPGSTTYLFPGASTAFTGDALVTLDAMIGQVGPRVLCRAFTCDSAAALTSLARVRGADIATVLTGHGEPWTDGIGSAVAAATAAGIH